MNYRSKFAKSAFADSKPIPRAQPNSNDSSPTNLRLLRGAGVLTAGPGVSLTVGLTGFVAHP